MEPWPQIGSSAERSGAPGDLGLPTHVRRLGWGVGTWATSDPSCRANEGGNTDASRRFGHTARSGDPLLANTFGMLATMLPLISMVVDTPQRTRPHKRSNGGS
jgi:hypothetical protein